MRCKLVVRNGQHAGQVFHIGDGESKILGRDASCEMQMYDKGLSRNHSLVESKDDRFVLSDLGSTNGTFVNGKMIISKPLEEGDLVNVGKIQLQFFLERSENPVSSSVRIVEDLDPIGPGTIIKRMDIDSVVFPKGEAAPEELQEQLGHYQQALKTIYQVGIEINAAKTLDGLYNRVMDIIMDILKAERGFVILYHPDAEEQFETVVARGQTTAKANVSRTILTKAVSEGLSVLSSNAMADDRFKGGMSIILNQIKSVMAVPLKSHGGQIHGAIYVDSRGTSDVFKDSQLELLSIIGMQAGITAERITLNDQLFEQEKMKQALEVAHNIQRSFLPDNLPDSLGLDIVGWSESCDETGGDYYDFVEYEGGQLGLAIGDVSGHGVGAALLMATARAFLRALVGSTDSMSELFTKLNALLEADLEDDQFMTLFYGVLDPKQWTLTYSSAGHDPPLIYRVLDDKFDELDSLGVPLGMVADYEYGEAGPVRFLEGDILLLSTDGIVESMNEDNQEFGKERMMEVIRSSTGASANQIVRNIHSAVTEFSQGRPPRDDLTLVVVKFDSRGMMADDIESTNCDSTQGAGNT